MNSIKLSNRADIILKNSENSKTFDYYSIFQ